MKKENNEKRIDICIPILGYEPNFEKLIDSIKKQEEYFWINKIYVIIDECSTKFKIIENNKIIYIYNKARMGKYYAINQFLKKSNTEFCLLISADVILAKNSIRDIMINFENSDVGIISSNPKPLNKNSGIGRLIKILWHYHNEISKKSPKMGEFIAFRKVIDKIPETIVDEEEICSQIIFKGYKKSHSNAICYNTGPNSIKDLIKQRRRIYCGHLDLNKRHKYEVPTNNLKNLIIMIFNSKMTYQYPISTLILIIIEIYSRILGYYDYLTNKNKHVKWDIVKKYD